MADAQSGEFHVVVVANGCTDDTAAVAAAQGAGIRVLTTPVPSKAQALKLGDRHAAGFPRLYVDADVELTTAAARALAGALDDPAVHAVAPARVLDLTGRPHSVRWYYDIWERLPAVRSGLFGRGVVAVDEAGHARIAALPEVMNDDLAASVAFTAAERRVVPEATVVVHTPRTLGDLVRRRIRAVTGTTELAGRMAGAADARTTGADLIGVLRADPAAVPRMAVFLAVTLVVRRRARRPIRDRDYTTWLRDDSSRAPALAEEQR